jgi:2-keto-4-pentenoate hydratase/2-oxohepta-3-ene-1,7-dioic acid hydratase in catechol pathway
MKLLMFASNGQGAKLGVLENGRVIDVAKLAETTKSEKPPATIVQLIEGGDRALEELRKLVGRDEAKSDGVATKLESVKLLSPFHGSRSDVLAIGLNYRKHAEEGARIHGTEVKPPTIFTKAALSLTGPYDDIVADEAITKKLDWEVELGVVVGKPAANIKRERWRDHVFGYTIVNDVSARDMQHGWGGQWYKGKSVDASSPCGPWVVTADEIPDPQKLDLRCSVNGVVKQQANTRDMIYPVDALMEWTSVGMTLPAGMLIASGTPEGIGNARTPPEFLVPGHVMETEIEGIGVLRNAIVGVLALQAR